MAQASKFHVKRTEEADKLFLVHFLNTLLEQEGNYLGVYDVLIDQTGDADLKSKMREFKGDHVRHVDAMTEAVTNMGGVPHDPTEMTAMMEMEAQMMSHAADDREAMAYFEIQERQSSWLYDCARGAPGLPRDVNAVLEGAYQDEQKHHAWATAHLGGPEGTRS